MAQVAAEVLVAGKGGLYKAPLGQAEPTGADSTLDAAYLNLGYFSSDGVPISFEDNTTNIVAWQGSVVVRSARTESLARIQFTPIQTRGSVVETFFAGSEMAAHPTESGQFRMPIKPLEADPSTWVFDAIDGTKHLRWWIPNGEVTERGDVMNVSGEAIGWPLTVTFYPDSAGNLAYLIGDIAALGLDIA